MAAPHFSPRRIAVLGAGISGLAAAHRLGELDPTVALRVFERGSVPGGVLQTEERQGYLLERSADNFITNLPWGIDLCGRLGLADELLPTNPVGRRALVVFRGRLVEVPAGFQLLSADRLWPVATTPLLSLGAKLRLAVERFLPARQGGSDESLAAFARRRLGREVFERLVEPLVAGIYTADPERLSMAAALPRFVEWEQQHGSLLAGMRHAARQRRAAARAAVGSRGATEGQPADDAGADDAGARYRLFVAPRRGMGSLVEALVARLPFGTLALGAQVRGVNRDDTNHWQVRWSPANDPGAPDVVETFDGLVVALPAPAAASVVTSLDAELGRQLASIEYASSSVVCWGCRRSQIGNPLDGFGFVVPRAENRRILACSFGSQKFPGRAAADRVLLRVFVGGARRPDLAALDDGALRQLVAEELGQFLALRGEPELFQVVRWPGAMPQYHLGHLDRVAAIEHRVAQHPGLALAGNAYRGVGVPQCIGSGEAAAEQVMESLRAALPRGMH